MPHISEHFIAPCWHMKVEHEKDDCNMVLSQDLSEQDVKLGVRVDLPHLENSEPVTKGQALVLYRPKPSSCHTSGGASRCEEAQERQSPRLMRLVCIMMRDGIDSLV